VFFFQAEDGIRDFHVTGVQTCALPICYHAEIDRPDESVPHVARVGIVTDARDTGRYVRRLSQFPEFREAEAVAGAFDLIVKFEAATAARLDQLLDEVLSWPATVRTTTFVVLRRYT